MGEERPEPKAIIIDGQELWLQKDIATWRNQPYNTITGIIAKNSEHFHPVRHGRSVYYPVSECRAYWSPEAIAARNAHRGGKTKTAVLPGTQAFALRGALAGTLVWLPGEKPMVGNKPILVRTVTGLIGKKMIEQVGAGFRVLPAGKEMADRMGITT